MAHLARTRRSELSKLDDEPQKDLRAVHSILQRGILEVEATLRQLEHSYYGEGRTAIDEASRWAAAIRPMLSVAGVTAFLNVDQVNRATRRRDIELDGLQHVFSVAAMTSTDGHAATSCDTTSDAQPADVGCRQQMAQNGATSGSTAADSEVADAPGDRGDGPTAPGGGPSNVDGISVAQNGLFVSTSAGSTASKNGPSTAGQVAVGANKSTSKKKAADDDDDDEDESAGNDALFILSRTLRDCLRKVLDAVPDSFEDIVADVRRLHRHLRKYCVSFYDPPDHDDPPTREISTTLDTAATYDDLIRRRSAAIDVALDDIRSLPDLFRRAELRVVDFGPFGAELARRAGCAHAPFLMLFAVCCDRIRAVLAEMRSWIEDDASYADFVSNDVSDLERQLRSDERRLTSLRQAFHQLVFRARQASNVCDQLLVDLGKTQGREDQLVVDEELLASETADLRAEMETTEYRLAEISRNASHYTPDAHYEKLNELSERLREIRTRLPVAEQALVSVRQKLAQLTEKRNQFKAESLKLRNTETKRDEIAARMAEQEVVRDACALTLEAARRILHCKRSSDAITKIFYDRPAYLSNAHRLPGTHRTGEKPDDFDQTCRIVAARIDRDWPALYRALPFHPPRGVANVDRDVAEIDGARDPASVAAGRALARWRRYHTRACADDIAQTLKLIGREDVLRRVSNIINPPAPTNNAPAPSQVPDWIGPELIPYWREVERFDQIRASHRS